MRSYTDLLSANGLKLELHLPDTDSFPLFIYFHGGGLVGGGVTACRNFAETLCKRGIGVLGVQYHLYPKEGCGDVHYPMYIDDCAAAVKWAFEHIGEYGDCTGIYAGGSSAGGYISMMLCFNKTFLAAYDLAPTDLAGFIHDAGQPTAHFNVLKKERGVDHRRVIVDETAPLYYVGMDAAYPPMIFFVSDHDMENRLEQTELMLSTLRHFGHTEENGIHHKLLEGTHNQTFFDKDENGDSLLGLLIEDFIKMIEAERAAKV